MTHTHHCSNVGRKKTSLLQKLSKWGSHSGTNSVPNGFPMHPHLYLVPVTWYLVTGTRYLVPGTRYQVPCNKYLVPAGLDPDCTWIIP